MHADHIRSIETRAFAAWPSAFTGNDDGWLLRVNNGYTKRANSANALRPGPGLLTASQEDAQTGETSPQKTTAFENRLQAFIARVEAFYTARSLATVFRLTPLAGDHIDSALDRAGYRLIEPTFVMTASLREMALDVPENAWVASGNGHSDNRDRTPLDNAMKDPAYRVALRNRWNDGWSDDYAKLNKLSSEAHVAHETILGNVRDHAIFASAEDLQTPSNIGLGMAVVEGDMIGVFDVIVDDAQRNRGIGRRLVMKLLAWGREQGAQTAYLQVTTANAPAVHLYRQLGFNVAYGYHYRIKDHSTT